MSASTFVCSTCEEVICDEGTMVGPCEHVFCKNCFTPLHVVDWCPDCEAAVVWLGIIDTSKERKMFSTSRHEPNQVLKPVPNIFWCPCCQDIISEDCYMFMPCEHVICQECITFLLTTKRQCPECRLDVMWLEPPIVPFVDALNAYRTRVAPSLGQREPNQKGIQWTIYDRGHKRTYVPTGYRSFEAVYVMISVRVASFKEIMAQLTKAPVDEVFVIKRGQLMADHEHINRWTNVSYRVQRLFRGCVD